MPRIGLIDYGTGNVGSVRNALEFLGVPTTPVTRPADFDAVSHLILPGVGAFGAAMNRLRQLDLLDSLRDQILVRQKPFLGICVGMQILATMGTEFGDQPGLDVVPGRIERLDLLSPGLPLPHVGWNSLTLVRPDPLFTGLPEHPDVYFVHSYGLPAAPNPDIAATCDYGGEFVAAVQRDRVFGVQFHPEKSQRAGLRILANFCRLS